MKGFVFDINKCVGCQACIVACSVENEVQPQQNWREVFTFNKWNLPNLPVFNLSLACNHCEQASCLEACPSKAYTTDEITGAVLLNDKVCMGCKYCTWACPYDAPKYNMDEGVINKCTFCNERLLEGGVPACSRNCPTGALGFNNVNDDTLIRSERGFPVSKINPRTRFIRERKPKELEIIPSPISGMNTIDLALDMAPRDSKISLNKDWTLLIFTLLVPLLVSINVGVLAGFVFISPWLFISIGVIGLLLSTLHLGKKMRALYAIRNLKTSWLSREIFFYGLFLISTIVFLFLDPLKLWLGIVSIVFGGLCLFAMDKVYMFFKKDGGLWLDSASVFLTGLMWIAFILQEPIPLFFIIGIKSIRIIYETKEVWNKISVGNKILDTTRIFLLVILPLFLLFVLNIGILYLFIPLFFGEVIGRINFYSRSYIDSPANEYYNLLSKGIGDGKPSSININ